MVKRELPAAFHRAEASQQERGRLAGWRFGRVESGCGSNRAFLPNTQPCEHYLAENLR